MPTRKSRQRVIRPEEIPKKNSPEFKALTNNTHMLSEKKFLDNLFRTVPSSNEILSKHGGVQCLYDLYQDNEIIKSDIEKRMASVTCTKYSIETENETVRALIEENIGPCYYDLVRSISWSIYHGYSVTELVWDEMLAKEQGIYMLSGVFSRKAHLFQPLYDLKSCIYLGDRQYNKEIAPFGKYLLSINDGSPENPHGDALLCRLYYLELYRKKALNYWIKCLERYGYPFLYGKTEADCVEILNDILENAREGSAITTDRDSHVELLSANVNTQQFLDFENSMRHRIHLCILGQNLTSEVTGGSFAAAKVHQQVAIEKTKADTYLVEAALNQLIRIILVLNGLEDEQAFINVEVNEGLEIERATRDDILCRSGKIKLTPEYFRKHYGLEEEDFEVVDSIPVPQTPVNFFKQEAERLELAERRLTPEVQELEDLTNFLANRADTIFNTESLASAIRASSNKKELLEQLSALGSNPDISFEEILTEAYIFSMVQGAVNAKS